MWKFLCLLIISTLTVAKAAPAISEPDSLRATPFVVPQSETVSQHPIVPIISSEVNKQDDGSYSVHYESADGTIREEKANVVDAGTEEEALEVQGSYKYINENGEEVEVYYTAGKNGFVPYGSIINPDISAVAEAAKFLPKPVEYLDKVSDDRVQRQQ